MMKRLKPVLPSSYPTDMNPSLPSALRVCILCAACALSACRPDPAQQAFDNGQQAFATMNLIDALRHYDEAIALDATYADAFLARGKVRWMQREYEKALPDFDEALRLGVDDSEAYFYRGASYMSIDSLDAALADFEVVTQRNDLPDQDLARAHRWRSIAFMNRNQYEASVTELSHCINLMPDVPLHYFERGRLYEELQQTDAAVADFEQFLALSNSENRLTNEAKNRLSNLQNAVDEKL